MEDFIELGKISGFFGVKGWVKIYSHTRPRIGIGNYSLFCLGAKKTPIRFTRIKSSGKNIIGHIEGVDTREAAQPYIGQSLFIRQDELPQLDNEYYWHQLIGLTVINRQGVTLGKITEMLETGANDVMVIHAASGEEILIPYAVSHFVLSVDLDKSEIHVDWELDDNELGG